MDIFHIIICFLTNSHCKCNTFFNKKRFLQKKIRIIFSVNRKTYFITSFQKIKCPPKENHTLKYLYICDLKNPLNSYEL